MQSILCPDDKNSRPYFVIKRCLQSVRLATMLLIAAVNLDNIRFNEYFPLFSDLYSTFHHRGLSLLGNVHLYYCELTFLLSSFLLPYASFNYRSDSGKNNISFISIADRWLICGRKISCMLDWWSVARLSGLIWQSTIFNQSYTNCFSAWHKTAFSGKVQSEIPAPLLKWTMHVWSQKRTSTWQRSPFYFH